MTKSTQNIIYKAILSEEVINYIQRLNYEREGYLTLLRTIVSFDRNREFFHLLRKEFIEKNTEYQLVFEEIKQGYVEKDVLDILTPKHQMKIDFSTNEFVIYLQEGGHTCGV